MAFDTARIGTIICPSNGGKTDHALRLKPDHPIGAGHNLKARTVQGSR